MAKSLQDRIECARALRKEGYNCCQSVVMAFDDVLEVPADVAARMSASFGSGFAGQGHMCGTVAALGLVSGALRFSGPADKKTVYASVSGLSDRFKSVNGSIICKELLATREKSCMGLIEDAVSILHESLEGGPAE